MCLPPPLPRHLPQHRPPAVAQKFESIFHSRLAKTICIFSQFNSKNNLCKKCTYRFATSFPPAEPAPSPKGPERSVLVRGAPPRAKRASCCRCCRAPRAWGGGAGGYRGTSLIRNRPPLGPYSRTMPRALWKSLGGGAVSYEHTSAHHARKTRGRRRKKPHWPARRWRAAPAAPCAAARRHRAIAPVFVCVCVCVCECVCV